MSEKVREQKKKKRRDSIYTSTWKSEGSVRAKLASPSPPPLRLKWCVVVTGGFLIRWSVFTVFFSSIYIGKYTGKH